MQLAVRVDELPGAIEAGDAVRVQVGAAVPAPRVAVIVPYSASHGYESGWEYVMVISAPPDKFIEICPVKVLTLPHTAGAEPVPVMAPDEDTVPDEKRMPWVPLVMVNVGFVNTPLVNVAVNVPAAVSPQPGQVTFQLPVYIPSNCVSAVVAP